MEMLFTIVKGWKQSKYSLRDERINKMWYMCEVEYCSALQSMG